MEDREYPIDESIVGCRIMLVGPNGDRDEGWDIYLDDGRKIKISFYADEGEIEVVRPIEEKIDLLASKIRKSFL